MERTPTAGPKVRQVAVCVAAAAAASVRDGRGAHVVALCSVGGWVGRWWPVPSVPIAASGIAVCRCGSTWTLQCRLRSGGTSAAAARACAECCCRLPSVPAPMSEHSRTLADARCGGGRERRRVQGADRRLQVAGQGVEHNGACGVHCAAAPYPQTRELFQPAALSLVSARLDRGSDWLHCMALAAVMIASFQCLLSGICAAVAAPQLDGANALHMAARHGHVAVAELLLAEPVLPGCHRKPSTQHTASEASADVPAATNRGVRREAVYSSVWPAAVRWVCVVSLCRRCRTARSTRRPPEVGPRRTSRQRTGTTRCWRRCCDRRPAAQQPPIQTNPMTPG